jgi:hypothetical protein
LYLSTGGGHPERAAEATYLRHHKCAGRHRTHREAQQELHQVDGRCGRGEHTGQLLKRMLSVVRKRTSFLCGSRSRILAEYGARSKSRFLRQKEKPAV